MTANRQFSLTSPGLRLDEDQFDTPQDPPIQAAPTMERVLAQSGPFPREALFLGVAADGLPVLLNLRDPLPGAMLVIGDAGAGKSAFLQSIARSLLQTHPESEVQYGVITNDVGEWEDVEKSAHHLGVFDVNQADAGNFVLSLTSWAHSNRNAKQSILLLVDDLEAAAKMDLETLQNFRWLLLRGPARQVWPVITLDAERYGQVFVWIENFRTRVFGRIENPLIAQALGGDNSSALDQLEAGRQFSLRENGSWLRFWLPSF
ncbi:MAG TPA: FtsK/SpoIIIE domain-containing protein [Anaerolineales bacterium]|nr:FtsK/SpoIIIE domain-containing protein [Anaerolineales bacterium]